MKSLDIDSISTNSREYGSQRVIIEYTGGIHRQRLQQGTAYKVTVPYGSFSQKLQTIHRFGGKIISVSIPYLQLDSPQVVSEVNLEQVSEPILTIAIEQFVEVIPNNPLEINVESTVENVFEEPSEVICEIGLGKISQIIPETLLEPIPENVEIVPAVETPVASPKKKKSVSETTTKPKKPKTSTKSSQGFSKQEAIFQPKASVSEVSEPIIEAVVEIIAEPITETIVDEITEVVAESIISSEISSKTDSELTVEQAIEAIAKSSLPETKSKKSKTTSKSGSGFNKPKDDTKTSRPPRKPKH